MAEFAGYIGNQVPPTDWGKIGTQLFDQYNEVKKDRDDKRQVIEDDFATTFQKIGEYETTTDQTLNEYLYKGVDQARNALKTQYDLLKRGAINMSDYKLKKNTLMTDWGNVSKAVKLNAGILSKIQKMNESGEMSGFGRYRSEKYGQQLDIKDGQLYVNPDSLRIYGTKANPQTGKVDSTSNVYSPVSMINESNIVDKRVDLNDGISTFLKRVAEFGEVTDLGGGKIKVSENARENPKYQAAVSAQVTAMTVTPFKATSILIDYAGGYQAAETESEKKALIAKGVPADKIITAERVNGVLTPKLTPTQQKAAESYVRDQIEVGVGQKESQTQGYAPQRADKAQEPSVWEKKEQKRIERNISKLKAAKEFMDPSGGKARWGEIKQVAIDNGATKVTISERPDGSKILYGIPRGKKKVEVIQEFRTGPQAFSYLTGRSNVSEGVADYDEAMEEADFRGINVNPAPKESITFDMKAARQMAPDLSDEEIKAKIIKQYPGKKLIWKN
jgi:hypothetical protein